MSSELVNKLIQAGIDKSEAVKEISILKKEFSDPLKISEIIEERVRTRKPLQYLIKKAYFMDFEVTVNEKVLIPRPETEILVEEAVKRINSNTKVTAIDIGTGSGIIAIALSKMILNIEVTAIDINNDIVNIAHENAKKNNADKKIHFEICDLFSGRAEEIFKNNKFNLIVSNPPYVSENGFSRLEPEVRCYEPKIALVGSGVNNLTYYERILLLARKNIKPGLIAFEIDPSLVNDLKLLLKRMNLKSGEFLKDYSGQDRYLFINI